MPVTSPEQSRVRSIKEFPMFKVIKVVVLAAICYLGYVNFVKGSKAEKIAVQAADVGKKTVELGKEGLDTFDAGVKSQLKEHVK
jgi:hypothetical protein